MLQETAATLAAIMNSPEALRVIRVALFESFIIHARTLLDCLYAQTSPPPKPDDIIAEDYFNDSTIWDKRRPPKTPLLTTVHKRAGKEVVHLTYARLTVVPDQKGWRYLEIADAIRSILAAFYQLVPRSKVGDTFRKSMEGPV